MKCKHAREIINRLMDGELPSLASEAQAHVDQCPECREWQRGLEGALLLSESWDEEPAPFDISAAVMAGLPERHPASLRASRAPMVRRVLAWTGVMWLAGAAVLAGLALLISRRIEVEVLNTGVLRAYQILRSLDPVWASVSTAAQSLSSAVRSLVIDLGTAATGYGPLALRFVALDFAVFAIIIGVWWSRRRFARVPHIFAL